MSKQPPANALRTAAERMARIDRMIPLLMRLPVSKLEELITVLARTTGGDPSRGAAPDDNGRPRLWVPPGMEIK